MLEKKSTNQQISDALKTYMKEAGKSGEGQETTINKRDIRMTNSNDFI